MIVVSFVRKVCLTSCLTVARACERSFNELAFDRVDHGVFFVVLVSSDLIGSMSGLWLIILFEKPVCSRIVVFTEEIVVISSERVVRWRLRFFSKM